MFQKPFHFNLPTGSSTYPSTQGLVFTVILTVILIVYGLVQLLTLLQYSNSIITVNIIDSALTEEYDFDLDIDKSFQLAFGLTYYDGNLEMLEFDDVAKLVPRLKTWSKDGPVVFHDLSYRPCTEQELGLTETESSDSTRFFQAHQNSKDLIRLNKKKFYCIDDHVNIHGNYNSVDVSHLQLQLQICNPSERQCKSDAEIEESLKRLFIITINNSIRFDQTVYGDEKAIKESKFTYHAVKSSTRSEEIWEILNSELRLQDSQFFSFGDISENSLTIFDIISSGERPYEFPDFVHWTISYEMHLNIRTYDREVYNALDWIGDIGGLFDGLRGISILFLGILTYRKYDNFMVAQLYQCQNQTE